MPHVLPLELIAMLGRYGYWVLIPIAVIEGPAITMVAGALVAANQMNGVTACALLVLADLVGDALYYSLGRYGHGPLARRLTKWLKVTPEKLARLEQRFRANDWKLILIGKTQGLGSIILYFAGASRMPFLRYMVLNLIGTVPKVILFGAIGVLLGESIMSSAHYINYITGAMFAAAALVLLALYWLFRKYVWKDLVQGIST
jgi:membrane protein DedA with SNARE-associated domain